MAARSAALLSAEGEATPKVLSSSCCERVRSLPPGNKARDEPVEVKWVWSLAMSPARPLRVMSTLHPLPPRVPEKGETMSTEGLWQEFFSDPSQWWDNRVDKKSPRSPDFRHKRTKEALWIQDWRNPPWVKAELAAMIEGQAQCGDLRMLCMAGRLKEALHTLNQQGWADSNTYVCLLQECMNIRGLAEGKQVHAHIIHSGFKPNIFLLNTLVNMYAKCGSLVDARQVFDTMHEHDVLTCTIMIAVHVKHGCGREALEIYELMRQEGIMPTNVTYVCILKACASLGALEKGKEVHAHILKAGITPDIILETALAVMYANCGSMKGAHQVFDNIGQRDVVSWNAMITGYAKHGCGREALEMYKQMIREGMMPNKVTFICVLNACASLVALEEGKEVHANIIKAEIHPDIILETALVNMYAKCGNVNDAREVFGNMAQRNVVSWSAMITGYAQHGCGREAFRMYEQMIGEGVTPNKVTFISVLNACASLAALDKGKRIHADIIKARIASDISLENTLVNMYAKCGNMKHAQEVFNNMTEKDVVVWSAMISGYAEHGCCMEALETYEQMIRKRVAPDKVTFICVLNACASLGALEKGKEVHFDIVKAGIGSYINLENTLVNMYAKCGSMKDARLVFDTMAEKDVVSWSAMIAGYAQHGCIMEAFETYEQMTQEGVTPNNVTFICVLNVCASLAALHKGKEVHADIINSGIPQDIFLGTALVNMYAKCGNMKDARQMFDNMAEQDVVSWSAMIAGYAQHGCGRAALQLFEQMQEKGLKPNGITFMCVLSACSHVGLVDEGRHYFDSMSQDHSLNPMVEHFGCMVDLLGRAGRVDEAEDFIDKMPMEPDAGIWGALLGACRIHGNVEVAERVARCLLKWDPQHAATYMLLSIVYAAADRWADTAKVRKMMQYRGVRKEPGQSCIAVNNQLHTFKFIVEEKQHPQIKEIHAELKRLSGWMKEAGYIPETPFVLHEVEEQRESYLCHHSEKLAIVFGLISTPPTASICVIKNLRVCGDCHAATKFISKVTKREILVRDANRFHHFQDGVCSCGDYW